MVENGPATTPSAEQIDEWVKTFTTYITTYTTAQMRQIVRAERFRLKPEGVAAAPGPTDKDALRAEQADLARKMAAFLAQRWPLVKAERRDTVYEASVASDDQYPYRGYDQYADRDYQ